MKALVVAAMLAVSSHQASPDVELSHAYLVPLVTPATSLLHLHVLETTTATPRRFTLAINLRYWPRLGLGAKEYAKCGENFDAPCGWIRTKADLAPPGHSKPFNFTDIRCARNRYYARFHASGVSSTGNRTSVTLFWPAGDDGTDPAEPPTRLESKLISSCHPH